MKTEKIYVSFHVGRGGHYNNPGTLSFSGEEDFQQLISRCSDVCMIIIEDENGEPIADEDWQLVDLGGNIILEGREEIENNTGRLEWDGEYDTDYVETTDNLSDDELECLWNAYLNEEYMSDELKDEICTLNGMKRVHEVKRYPANLTVFDQDASTDINTDGKVGELTREEWQEYLEEIGFCPFSVEMILDFMDRFFSTNTTDFFAE